MEAILARRIRNDGLESTGYSFYLLKFTRTDTSKVPTEQTHEKFPDNLFSTNYDAPSSHDRFHLQRNMRFKHGRSEYINKTTHEHPCERRHP